MNIEEIEEEFLEAAIDFEGQSQILWTAYLYGEEEAMEQCGGKEEYELEKAAWGDVYEKYKDSEDIKRLRWMNEVLHEDWERKKAARAAENAKKQHKDSERTNARKTSKRKK